MNVSSNVFASIVKEVKKECFVNDFVLPSNGLISMIVRLFLLIQSNEINWNSYVGKKEFKSFVSSVVQFCKNATSPFLMTMKLQYYFINEYPSVGSIIETRCKSVEANTLSLLQNILQSGNIKSREQADRLCYQMVCYSILISGLGDPADSEVTKQTNAALRSVLSAKEIIRFSSKPMPAKEQQLKDVCHIVTGIRLYNNYRQQIPKESDNFLTLLEKGMNTTYNYLANLLKNIQYNVTELTLAVQQYYSRNKDKPSDLEMSFKLLNLHYDIAGEDIEYAKRYIYLKRQLELYVRSLSNDVYLFNDELQSTLLNIKRTTSRISKTIKRRTAVPVVEIYPLFGDLAILWSKLQDLMVLLNSVSNAASYLCSAAEKVPHSKLMEMVDISDQTCLEKSETWENVLNFCSNSNSNYQILIPENYANFYSIPLQFQGFCMVTFVETEGLLVPAAREHGIVNYNSMYYAFSSTKMVGKFCACIEKYVNITLIIIKRYPELVLLLEVEKQLEEYNSSKRVNAIAPLKASTADVSMQTELHPVPYYKNPKYSSNTWDLRKQVLHLGNIRNCRTHSSQTECSSYRTVVSTQTNACRKEISIQTQINSATNTSIDGRQLLNKPRNRLSAIGKYIIV